MAALEGPRKYGPEFDPRTHCGRRGCGAPLSYRGHTVSHCTNTRCEDYVEELVVDPPSMRIQLRTVDDLAAMARDWSAAKAQREREALSKKIVVDLEAAKRAIADGLSRTFETPADRRIDRNKSQCGCGEWKPRMDRYCARCQSEHLGTRLKPNEPLAAAAAAPGPGVSGCGWCGKLTSGKDNPLCPECQKNWVVDGHLARPAMTTTGMTIRYPPCWSCGKPDTVEAICGECEMIALSIRTCPRCGISKPASQKMAMHKHCSEKCDRDRRQPGFKKASEKGVIADIRDAVVAAALRPPITQDKHGAKYECVGDVHAMNSPLVLRDLGPHYIYRTIANDAEAVVASLVGRSLLPAGRRLFYYDSEGRLNEILVKNGRFDGFFGADEDDLAPKVKGKNGGTKS